ncbi:MAG: N-acetylneuraminate synthase family protein, partial [Parachlamydia sp.]|nr:N-acetylneuraminate synthase family protein [Parachlamydia sp.]
MYLLLLFTSFNLCFFTLLDGLEKNRSAERRSNSEIQIGSHKIGPDHPPFIVAKLWGNHIGSLQKALEIVEAAKEAGAHAVKLQTYTPDTITLDIKEGKFLISHPQQKTQNISLYDIYEEAYTAWEWHKPIFELCH